MGETTNPPPPGGALSRQRVMALGLLFLVDLVLTLVMLFTDQNLQSDFGSQPKYYLHWYALLGTGILDLVAGVVILGAVSMSSRGTPSRSVPRWVVLAGLGWAILAIIGMLGIVETYSQVGFPSASEFAKFLFGVTAYPGALSYIPWLFDLLLAMYFVTAVLAAVALRRVA